jgi:predicted dehydrogenase
MKLALLGCTPQAIAFVTGASRLGHQVLTVYDAGGDKAALRDAVPTIRFRDDWEDLLGEREIDALIIAGPTLPEDVPADLRERRDDQLRKLIQAGVPLIVIPPVCEAIVGFELEMIRRDVKGIIVPALAGPLHPAIDDVADLLAEKSVAALGEIELVAIERQLPLRSRSDVLAALVHDAEILRRLAGPFKRLTASGAVSGGESKPSLANLSVHVEAEAAYPLRWSAAPAGESPGAKLTIVGSAASLTLQMPATGPWRLINPDQSRGYEAFDSVAAVLEQLEAALAGPAEPRVTWLNACRAVEAMEAIDRSLARGRAIDLYNEEHSEQSSFKGIMAAGGCLILLITLAVVSFAGVLAVIVPPGKPREDDPARYGAFHSYWTWLQVCLLVPLGLFLLAQLLSFGLSWHQRNKQAARDSAANSAD